MLKPFLVLTALVLLGGAPALPQQAPPPGGTPPAPESKIPPEAVNEVNPVKPTAQSLARAKQIYGYDCAVCHGDNGDGTGDLAKTLKSKVPDFRDPSTLKGQTDGELFYIIKNGKGEMEGEGERAKPDEIWNLVIYLRSFSKSQAAAAARGPE